MNKRSKDCASRAEGKREAWRGYGQERPQQYKRVCLSGVGKEKGNYKIGPKG